MPNRFAPADHSARDRALGVTGIMSLVAGVLVLLAIGGASVLLALRNADALALANQTERARAAIAAVMTSVQDAETGQRGFLLTGGETYLQPYLDGVRHLPTEMEMLNVSLPLAAERRRLVVDLDRAIEARMAELKETLDLARAGDRTAALAVVRSDRGERTMNTIRDLATQILIEEQAIYERQIRLVDAGGRLLMAADAAALLVVLLLAFAVGRGVRRSILALREAHTELVMTNALLARANDKLALANDELEARVRSRTLALTEANDEIQRFAYIVSHDLRAPLVNIIGFTGELEDATRRLSAFVERASARHPEDATEDVRQAAAEDLPEAIRFIEASSAKMDRLIAAILRLSREGQRVLAPERIAMEPFLRTILDSVRHQSGAMEAEISLEPAPDIVADRLVMEQIFSNLIENALKYLKPGRPGRITVGGRNSDGFAEYRVTDNGRGIAAHDHERVFELFRRAGNQSVAGEGIGLAHVRALVRRLGGKIDCESTLDVGSTFRVTVPLISSTRSCETTSSTG